MKTPTLTNLRSLSFLLIALVSGGLGAAAQAQLQQVASTPYDRQMTPVRNILEQRPQGNGGISLTELNGYMRELRSIPYQYSLNWKTPEQVQTEFKADCKAKAIALYSILKQRGVTDVRLVIGMRTKKSKITHAWLEMDHNGKTLLLDPTYYNRIRTVSDERRGNYVQNYAYEGGKKFRI